MTSTTSTTSTRSSKSSSPDVADAHFKKHTWEDLKGIISKNDLASLRRVPSDLARYRSWSVGIKQEYGDLNNFLLKHRLRWTPISTTPNLRFEIHSPVPFTDPRDYTIINNDWPYGVSPGIVHICTWSKVPIATDPESGDVTDESRRVIEEFVKRVFVERIRKEGFEDADDKVMWFKNWAALQSVPGLEHVHVLVRDVPEKLVEEWTGEKRINGGID
ncbi:MAG: hypothetical protein M1834_002759 [Cirrosporium novae-zelandiae]|nr:MAG: hypothetical protein M1834_002759 [Cirrosporium novae-zelandiae]